MSTEKDSKELWWCNTHQREATVILRGEHHCDPKLGGIMFPCQVVNLTGIAEIEDDTNKLTESGEIERVNFMETKTEPTLETMTKEMEKIMPASKPSPKGKALLEQLNTMTPGVDVKPPTKQPDEKKSNLTLADFDAFLKSAPKEWLPTMMVHIANKCLAEKVFATPGAMAEAIVGASRK